jgi:hypothetical protein
LNPSGDVHAKVWVKGPFSHAGNQDPVMEVS